MAKNRTFALWLGRKLIGKDQPSQIKEILVVSATGFGDALWATPALRALHRAFPDSKISLLGSKASNQVLCRHPLINRIYPLSSAYSWFGHLFLIKRLRATSFDVVVVLHVSSTLPLLIAMMAKTGYWIGTLGLNKGLDDLFAHLVAWPQQGTGHEIDRRLKIVEALANQRGIVLSKNSECPYTLDFYADEKYRLLADDWWLAHGEGKRIVCLHLGGRDLFKRWPVPCFVELGKRLITECGVELLLSGSEAERPLLERAKGALGMKAHVLCSKSIGELAALLKKVALIVSNDTITGHLGAALARPTLILFGPTSPTKAGPRGQATRWVETICAVKTCSPCSQKKCEEPLCLLALPVEKVFARAAYWLKKKSSV